MNKKNPYLPINKEWLNLYKEEALLPDLEIIDPHHHLWNLEFGKYLNDDFIEDIQKSGHNVINGYLNNKTFKKILIIFYRYDI